MSINAVLTLDVTGGTGWTTGDVITLTGGTFTTAATAFVTATAGAIDSVAFGSRGFGYTAIPTGFTGPGSGGTINAVTVTVGAISAPYITDLTITGGTLYTVGDILTLTGGTPTTAAQARVTVIGGGGSITTVVFETRGAGYNSAPTGFTGGTGSGAAITYVTVGAIPPGADTQSAFQGPATPADMVQSVLQPVVQGPATPVDVVQSILQPIFPSDLIPLKFASSILALSIRPFELPVPVITPALVAGMTAVAGTAGAAAVTVRVTVGIDYFSPVTLGNWAVVVPALIAGQVVEARSQSAGALFESDVETVIVAPSVASPPDPPFPPHQNWAYGSKPL